MPNPASIIPASHPLDAVSVTQAKGAPGKPLAFKPAVSEKEFLTHFPLPYEVRAVTIYEAQNQGWITDRSYWQYLEPFRYVSEQWGPIDIPKGSYTDFASVPPRLHSIIDDDSPIILFPSSPHDFLFNKRADKKNTRGWINDSKQLSLTEVNQVLTEAMAICGANFLIRNLVFAAVEVANENIRGEFRH